MELVLGRMTALSEEERNIIFLALRHYINDTSNIGWTEESNKAQNLYMKFFLGEATK